MIFGALTTRYAVETCTFGIVRAYIYNLRMVAIWTRGIVWNEITVLGGGTVQRGATILMGGII